MPARPTSRISTRGQVVLPKAVRERRGWSAGVELYVEERPEGVLLRAAPPAAHSSFDDVRGSLGPFDRVVSIEEMNLAGLGEAGRRWWRKKLARD